MYELETEILQLLAGTLCLQHTCHTGLSEWLIQANTKPFIMNNSEFYHFRGEEQKKALMNLFYEA